VGYLLEATGRQPEQLTLIATAHLTNIALATERDAQTNRKLRALVVMEAPSGCREMSGLGRSSISPRALNENLRNVEPSNRQTHS
jgi:hypothetical protein